MPTKPMRMLPLMNVCFYDLIVDALAPNTHRDDRLQGHHRNAHCCEIRFSGINLGNQIHYRKLSIELITLPEIWGELFAIENKRK